MMPRAGVVKTVGEIEPAGSGSKALRGFKGQGQRRRSLWQIADSDLALLQEGIHQHRSPLDRNVELVGARPRHGPRPIDVDLLILGDETHTSERLTLPHEQVLARLEARLEQGFVYGDCQYSTDLETDAESHQGVFACYRPVPLETPIPEKQRQLSEADWAELYTLARTNKRKAFARYSEYYRSTSGRVPHAGSSNPFWASTTTRAYRERSRSSMRVDPRPASAAMRGERPCSRVSPRAHAAPVVSEGRVSHRDE